MDASEISLMRAGSSPSLAKSRARVLLVLGRVSNLPTVWSNCLAAWLLAGGGPWGRFALVCVGATLLYTGGMFLNDAVDVSFDRRYRPERPIPSGQIAARTVWILSFISIVSGWVSFVELGRAAIQFATALLLAIVFYDLVHKRAKLAPLVMASCRFLLYLLAASASLGAGPDVLWRAAALAGYIVGLSYLARGESNGQRLLPWTLGLLFVPIVIAFARPLTGASILALAAALQSAWTYWALSVRRPKYLSFLPKGVSGLLAGIVLVDWLAAAGHVSAAPFFLALFVLALILQRVAPAT